MVAITVAIEGSEHNTEGSSPLAEEDEEMVSQRLLREEEAPMVDCTVVSVRKRKRQETDLNMNTLVIYELAYCHKNISHSH